ncbi:MAG: glycosyltransferase family 2 protein [Pseudomonadota bacterium]
MRPLKKVALRMERRRRQIRARRKRGELRCLVDRTARIGRDDIILFSTVRNEFIRLPWFLHYYRRMGVRHFCFVDNESDDGTAAYLADQPDCSLWSTGASYKRSKFGVDWLNGLLSRHGRDHWVLVVDVDEFLVYPYCDTRPLPALTDWLDSCSLKTFPAMLLDLYPDGPIEEAHYIQGQDPLTVAQWFDGGNYTMRRDRRYGNLWIQGGPRMRAYFADQPHLAPALNKIPLVRWRGGYVYVSSTHSLLPRGLNQVYDEFGGEKASGCLLHAKFLHLMRDKAIEELDRRQHYAGSREYRAYRRKLGAGTQLKTPWSERYQGWRQLDELGLMSPGGWL